MYGGFWIYGASRPPPNFARPRATKIFPRLASFFHLICSSSIFFIAILLSGHNPFPSSIWTAVLTQSVILSNIWPILRSSCCFSPQSSSVSSGSSIINFLWAFSLDLFFTYSAPLASTSSSLFFWLPQHFCFCSHSLSLVNCWLIFRPQFNLLFWFSENCCCFPV